MILRLTVIVFSPNQTTSERALPTLKGLPIVNCRFSIGAGDKANCQSEIKNPETHQLLASWY
jgi:hypothetical protein